MPEKEKQKDSGKDRGNEYNQGSSQKENPKNEDSDDYSIINWEGEGGAVRVEDEGN